MQQLQFVKLTIVKIVLLWTIGIIANTTLVSVAAFAADSSKTERSDTKSKNMPIVITAEQLDSDNKAKFAEFIGNVKAIQADYVITSDKLRIYYKGELLNSEKEQNDEEILKKIVATGNVNITSEQFIAKAEKLEYDTASMTIVLIGENSTVINGKNSITGSKIILYQKDGRIKVLGGKNKRIKAEFFTKSETSDELMLEKPKQ
ncbi:MAG: LptA/OstA family protein [Desulfobacteraceae bacterium]|nr:LptA/OstA family protein [Desulfobacteraceae bacterium]